MSVTEYGTFEEWVKGNSRSEERGAGAGGRRKEERLRWRKPNSDASATVWLHTKYMPKRLYTHELPGIWVFEDRETRIITKKFNVVRAFCTEPEENLVRGRQMFLSRDTGEREYPPTVCGVCKMNEYFRREVAEGRLHWLDPVFEVPHDKGSSIFHAAAFFNGFRERELNDARKAELKAAGIHLTEAWRENFLAREQTLFFVVDEEFPERGVQYTIEKNQLTEAVMEVISKTKVSLRNPRDPNDDGSRGDPHKFPYAFYWEFKKDAPMRAMYTATRLELVPLRPEVERLIRGDSVPDVSKITTPPNYATLSAQLESFCLVKNVPWEKIFGIKPAETTATSFNRVELENEKSAEPKSDIPWKTTPLPGPDSVEAAVTKTPEPPAAFQAPEEDPKASRKRIVKPKVKEPEPPKPAVKTIPCDAVIDPKKGTVCGAPMLETDTVCSRCGAEYEID